MLKQSFTLFILLNTVVACKEKPHSKIVTQLVKEIATDNVLQGPAVGVAGKRPEQWDRFEALKSTASDDELLALTDDTNAVVRCYSFTALAQKNTVDLLPVVLKHLADSAVIHTFFGCLKSSQRTGDFFLETVTANYDSTSFFLTNSQNKIIDSVLLFQKGNILEAKNRMLSELQPAEHYYNRLRQLVVEEKNKTAVIALARYRKPQDKSFIEALLNDEINHRFGLSAVINFPDASFFPTLEQILFRKIKKNTNNYDGDLLTLYQAIIQYKTKESKQLLKKALQETKDMQHIYHSDYIHHALKKYPATIYNGLVKPIYPF